MSRPNARQTALSALRSWENGSRHADEILADLSRKNRLQGPEHALAQSLFYGVLRHLTRLDTLIDDLRRGHLNPELRCVLRLGLFQLFHTDIAEHAAVNETVALARGLRGVVNGILRNAQRRREELAALADTWPPAVRFSHPDFLIERWERQFGPEATEKLCRWNNEPPAVFARTNRLREGAEEALQTASEAARVPGKAGFFRLAEGAPPAAWIDEGLVYIQDPSTVLACNLLHPKRGERVLDACASPGGKTALMADRMKNGGRIVAADSSPDRLGLLRENLRRLGVENTESIVVDWLRPKKNFLASLPKFDAILVDDGERRIQDPLTVERRTAAGFGGIRCALLCCGSPVTKQRGVPSPRPAVPVMSHILVRCARFLYSV